MVSCKLCGAHTNNGGTMLCNLCWEVTSRLPTFLQYEAARARALVEMAEALHRNAPGVATRNTIYSSSGDMEHRTEYRIELIVTQLA